MANGQGSKVGRPRKNATGAMQKARGFLPKGGAQTKYVFKPQRLDSEVVEWLAKFAAALGKENIPLAEVLFILVRTALNDNIESELAGVSSELTEEMKGRFFTPVKERDPEAGKEKGRKGSGAGDSAPQAQSPSPGAVPGKG